MTKSQEFLRAKSTQEIPQSTTATYLQHLQDYNTQQGAVMIAADVHNTQGVLLIAEGERLAPQHIKKIIAHKLMKPIEASLGLAPFKTAQSMQLDLYNALNAHTDFQHIWQYAAVSESLAPCLQALEQFPFIMQKMTVMAAVMPELYQRTLLSGACVLMLVKAINYDKSRIIKAFIACCCENIGYLHLNPMLGQSVNPPYELWREYLVHPLIAKTILQEVKGLPTAIITAVIEHHERLDGSGFPQMLIGGEISQLGQLLGIIDETIRIRFSKTDQPISDMPAPQGVSLFETAQLMQFRRIYFAEQLYTALMSLIHQASEPQKIVMNEREITSFADLQLTYYAKCLVFSDVVARITDATEISAASQVSGQFKNIVRLNRLCKSYFVNVFSSGMLSTPLARFIEHCIESPAVDQLQALLDIDNAHKSILDLQSEIFNLFEHLVNDEVQQVMHIDSYANSQPILSLQAVFEYLKHLRFMKQSIKSWSSLVAELYDGEKDIAAIMASIKS